MEITVVCAQIIVYHALMEQVVLNANRISNGLTAYMLVFQLLVNKDNTLIHLLGFYYFLL